MNDNTEESTPLANEQPMVTEESIPENNASESQNTPVNKSRKENIIAKLENMTGDKKKAKLLFNLFIIVGILFILAVVLSIFQKPQQPNLPPVLVQPTPTPVKITPTPKPEIKFGEAEKLLNEVNNFDINLNDLTPPVLDLEISL